MMNNMIKYESEEEYIKETNKNMRKFILIENINELGLRGSRKERFVNFYYNNLDMNLLDALEKFKHAKI